MQAAWENSDKKAEGEGGSGLALAGLLSEPIGLRREGAAKRTSRDSDLLTKDENRAAMGSATGA